MFPAWISFLLVIALVLIFIEHFAIIALAASLFVAFNPFNLILAVVWTISRTLEGAIQIYNKKSYWGIINIAKQYSDASGAEKSSLINSARTIQKTKNTVFVSMQLLFSIGTLSYSILFATSSTVVPDYFGWFGIIASIIYGLGNAINLAKPNFKALWNLGGLLILIFELILGGWLLLSPFL